MRCSGWCGLCYSGARGRQAYKGHAKYRHSRAARQVYEMPFIHRSNPVEAVPVADAAVTGCGFAQMYEALWEYLTAVVWPDGKPRTPSTLLLFVQDGAFKLCLSDKAQNRSLWVSGPSYTAVLDRLEGHLRQGTGEWRTSYGGKGKRS